MELLRIPVSLERRVSNRKKKSGIAVAFFPSDRILPIALPRRSIFSRQLAVSVAFSMVRV